MGRQKQRMAIIDSDVHVKGQISGKGRLVVRGSVEGDIEIDELIVAEGGKVQGDTVCSILTIGGIISGQQSVKDLMVVLSTGRCVGQVTCGRMVVEAGGRLEAEVHCLDGSCELEPSPKESP